MATQTENFIALMRGQKASTIEHFASMAPHELREELRGRFGDNLSDQVKQIFNLTRI